MGISIMYIPKRHFIEVPKYIKTNLFRVRPWTPLEELTALSRCRSWWGGGSLLLPRTLTPALDPLGLA